MAVDVGQPHDELKARTLRSFTHLSTRARHYFFEIGILARK